MKYLISLISLSTLVFSLNYNSKTVIDNTIPTYLSFQDYSEAIQYLPYSQAEEEAISEEKFLLLKIESYNCKSCDKLNSLLDSNENLKNLIKTHTKAVKLNPEEDTLPYNLNLIGTPTVFLLNAETGKVLMKLQGNEASDELEVSLKSVLWE